MSTFLSPCDQGHDLYLVPLGGNIGLAFPFPVHYRNIACMGFSSISARSSPMGLLSGRDLPWFRRSVLPEGESEKTDRHSHGTGLLREGRPRTGRVPGIPGVPWWGCRSCPTPELVVVVENPVVGAGVFPALGPTMAGTVIFRGRVSSFLSRPSRTLMILWSCHALSPNFTSSSTGTSFRQVPVGRPDLRQGQAAASHHELADGHAVHQDARPGGSPPSSRRTPETACHRGRPGRAPGSSLRGARLGIAPFVAGPWCPRRSSPRGRTPPGGSWAG